MTTTPLARHLRTDISIMRNELDALQEAIGVMRQRLFSLAQIAEDVEELEESKKEAV